MKASATERQLRAALRDSLGPDFAETIAAFVQDALGAERDYRFDCEKCGARQTTRIPDWSSRAAVLRVLLDHGLGRPPTSDSAPPPPPPRLDLSQWTDEQLQAVVDGRYEPEPDSA